MMMMMMMMIVTVGRNVVTVNCGCSSGCHSSSSSSSSEAVRGVRRRTETSLHKRIVSTAAGSRQLRSRSTMNGILGQQVAERTALFRPGRSTPVGKQQAQQPAVNSGPSTPAAVHRVHSAPTKRPEPVCILGCCGFGKISILWTVSRHTIIIIIIVIIIVTVINNNILPVMPLLTWKQLCYDALCPWVGFGWVENFHCVTSPQHADSEVVKLHVSE